LVRALRKQLKIRDGLLQAGATRVGWKLGLGESERIAGQIAVGHLTSATCLEDGLRSPSNWDTMSQPRATTMPFTARSRPMRWRWKFAISSSSRTAPNRSSPATFSIALWRSDPGRRDQQLQA
jgi:hypothetical protein